MPASEALASKKEKPMNKPAMMARPHLEAMYAGIRQYCWKTRRETTYN